MRSWPLLVILSVLGLSGCRDELEVRVETAGFARDDVVVEVEPLGRPTADTLDELRMRGDVDGAALLEDGACEGGCRVALITLFIKNVDSERQAPPVVRFSSPPGKPTRVPIAYRGEEISADRTGRIRFLISLWPEERVLTAHVSGSVFIEVKSAPLAPPPAAVVEGGGEQPTR